MRLIHASGRYDRKRAVVKRVTRKHRAKVALRSRTELRAFTVWRNKRWAVLRKAGLTARGDCAIESKRKVWRRNSSRVVRVSSTYRLGRRCWVLVGRYTRRRDRQQVTIITAHLPASVEARVRALARLSPRDRGRVTHDRQSTAWLQAMAGLRTVIEEERRRRPGAILVVTADWNVNMRVPEIRAYVQELLGDHVTLARPPRGWDKERGTHGGRIIDWAAVSVPSTCRVMKRTPASDHNPIIVKWRTP